MADAKFDFYGGAWWEAVQFIYRRLGKAVHDRPDAQAEAIDRTLREFDGSDPELRQLKFFPPEYLRRMLEPAQFDRFDAALAARRKRAARLKMVYPLSLDEFSLDPEFLASVLDLNHGPTLKPGDRFFTIGSCFARNIQVFLSGSGYEAKSFKLTEELNSPISNAFLL